MKGAVFRKRETQKGRTVVKIFVHVRELYFGCNYIIWGKGTMGSSGTWQLAILAILHEDWSYTSWEMYIISCMYMNEKPYSSSSLITMVILCIPTFRYSTKLCRIFQSVTVLLWRIGKSVTVCLSWKSCGVNEMEMLSNSLFKKSSMRGSWTPARRTGRKHATISPQSQLVISPRKRGYIYFVATFASHIYYPFKPNMCPICKSATCHMTEKKGHEEFWG